MKGLIMYSEDVLAELVGVPREDIAALRDEIPEGWTTDKRKVLWHREGVVKALEGLGIGAKKIPPGWWAELEAQGVPGVEVLRELVVYRQTGNPGIVLCRLDKEVVRMRVRPTDVGLYTPRMLQEAVLERNGVWRAKGKPRKPRREELERLEGVLKDCREALVEMGTLHLVEGESE